jgi:hypothetical protein
MRVCPVTIVWPGVGYSKRTIGALDMSTNVIDCRVSNWQDPAWVDACMASVEQIAAAARAVVCNECAAIAPIWESAIGKCARCYAVWYLAQEREEPF